MSDEWGRDAMEAWAAERGLAFEGEGLFPAATPLLREGLGAGSHRAGVIVGESAHSLTTVSGFSKKPERHTMNIVRGQLPGGIEGAIGHHFHLELRHTGHDDDWLASPHTVVFAYVPEGARACRELSVSSGYVNVDPPDPGAAFDHLAGEVDVDATVEMRDGFLSVALPGVIEDPAALDSLCRDASTVAAAARGIAALSLPLDPTAPTRTEVLPAGEQWVNSLGAQIQWSDPPASVPATFDAYAGLTQGGGRISRWEVNRLALIAVFVIGVIGFGVAAFLAFVQGDKLEGAAVAAACIIGAPNAIRAALHAGDDIEEAQAGVGIDLLALDVFAREYARSRGMAVEDRDEFRRRYASPIPGTPQKVIYGPLGEGVTGRIVLWIARDDRFGVNYWNLAVLPAPDAPVVPPGYTAHAAGGVLTIAEQVPDEGRSVDRLDALRAVAAAAAGKPAGDAVSTQ
jgi:hypothetical protein